jgi:hypothetical protein
MQWEPFSQPTTIILSNQIVAGDRVAAARDLINAARMHYPRPVQRAYRLCEAHL